MKKRLWKLHSWLGLLCGIGLLVIGLSGSILVFHQEIARVAFAEAVRSDAQPGAERLPLEQLVEDVRAAHPEFWIAGWLPSPDEAIRDLAYLKQQGGDKWHKMRVDQFSGALPTEPLPYYKTLDGWLVALHYTFFADHIGLAITAIFAIGLIALSVTGLWIYRAFWKHLFRLRWKASARIFFSDVHKAIGIASAPLNLLLGFTGAYWNLSHLAHEHLEHDHEEERLLEPMLGGLPLTDLISAAHQELPEFQINYVYFPTTADPNIYLYGANPSSNPLLSPYGSWLGIEVATGSVSATHDLRQAGLWANVVDAFEPLHFGNFGGMVFKIIWCLAGLAPAALALSGSIIYFTRKKQAKRAGRSRAVGDRPQTKTAELVGRSLNG